MAPKTKVSRGRSASASHPRAVFSDLRTAHSNITGQMKARKENLPLLSPGWAGDQPASAGNPKSTPVFEKARTIFDETSTESPLANRSTQPFGPAPMTTSEIPSSDQGTRYPNIFPRETHSNALAPRPASQIHDQASHRRSRSVGFLSESFPWYEAEYASSQPLDPRDYHFPSAPLNTGGSSSQTPDFSLARQAIGVPPGSDTGIRASPRVLAATSTISDILLSYGDRNQVADRGFDDSSHSLQKMITDSSRSENGRNHRYERQLSQSAWSPRASNEGPGFHYQRHSTHGEIVDAHDEPRDAVNEFLEEVFRPRPESADSNARSNAYAMLVRPNGETISRPMSYTEMMRYENTVQTHISDPNSPSIFDAGPYAFQGRLSLEYQQPQRQATGYSAAYMPSSSSSSLATWDRRQSEAAALRSGQQARQGNRDEDDPGLQRCGTPPLLFGANAIDSDQPSNHLMPNRAYTDEGDWETVGDFSRQGTLAVPPTLANSSSFADYSSSSTGMRPAGLPPGGAVLEHPPHPRYMRTWNMFRDERTGQTMLLPENGTAQAGNVVGPNLASAAHGQTPDYQYHHPSPLSNGHTNPFTSSPMNEGSASRYSMDNSDQDEGHHNVLEMSPSARKPVKPLKTESNGQENSSAWISTEEGHSNSNVGNNASKLDIPINQNAYQGNVIGTPEGTGSRQTGSSIANASSPGVDFSSSPCDGYAEGDDIRYPEAPKQVYMSRSIDSSLSSLNSLNSEDSSWAARRQLHGQTTTDPEAYELTALPSFAHLSPEALFHRNQLIANNLLPRGSPPQSKRHSLGLGYLANSPSKMKKATAATGANLTRQIQQFVPNMPSLSAVRKRSPHRRGARDEHVSSDLETQNDEQRARKTKPYRNKHNTKSKVSDSEDSMDSDVGLNSSNPHHPASTQLQHIEPSMSTSIEPVELEGIQVHSKHTGFIHGQGSALLHPTSTQNVSFHTVHGNTTEYNVGRLITPPSVEEMLGAVRDTRRTPRVAVVNRPVARAESPHLHRIPGHRTDALLKRQKEFGRLVLVPCMCFPPLCLIYAFGLLDGLMDYSTHGALSEMPAWEKKFALFYAVASMAGIFAAVVWYLTSGAT